MYQKLIIVGYVGKDPEMRYTPQGQAVTNFSVATNRQYTKDGETVKQTVWFRVQTWGKRAEVCNQYLKKGSKVLVEGTLLADEDGNPKIWKKQDGSPGVNFEVNAFEVRFLSSAEKSNGRGEPEPQEEDFQF